MAPPECPYCGKPLDKTPARKTKCPACRQPIYVKRTPKDPVKRLMTEAQAEEAERAWEMRYVLNAARTDCQNAGVSDEQFAQALAYAGGDPDAAAQGALLAITDTAPDRHQRKMAHLALARRFAERLDSRWRKHLRRAQREELLTLRETKIDLVDILSGDNTLEPCRAMRDRQALSVDDELLNPTIPNPKCSRAYGGAEGFCGCMYIVAEAWFSRPH